MHYAIGGKNVETELLLVHHCRLHRSLHRQIGILKEQEARFEGWIVQIS